jgi:predicted kinase
MPRFGARPPCPWIAADGSVTAVMVGTEETRLVVLRGNSASGKSSVALGLRERFGRGLALVAQDNLRRIVLREHDRPGAANIGLIDLTARYALDAGYHVVVEGILYADRYGGMLARLRAEHRGPTYAYYLDVPFEETLARHATKPIADDVGEAQLRDWYRPRDLLPGGVETVIGADSPLRQTIDRIMHDTGLAGLPAPDL